MDMPDLGAWVAPLTVAVCLCAGYVLKNLVPSEGVNRFIPLCMAALGVAVTAWAQWAVTPDVVCTGLVSGLASTGLYEAFRHVLEGGENAH